MAATKKRQRLVGPVVLGFIFAAVAALLYLLFPRGSLDELGDVGRGDEVTLAYLRARLRANPDDGVRLLIAKQARMLGHFDEARAALAQIVGLTSPIGLAARQSLLELDLDELRALGPHDARRAAAQRLVEADLERLVHEGPTAPDREHYAGLFLELGLPGRAAALYEQLGAHRLAAKWFVADGKPQRAVQVLLAAALISRDPSERLALRQAALDMQIKTGLTADALKLALELLAETSDRAEQRRLLERSLALAAASGDRRQTELARRLLESAPNDLSLLRHLLAAELAVGNVAGALDLALRIAALDDSDAAWRQVARIAEWASRLDVAVRAWTTLARRSGQKDDIDNALRVARGDWNGDVVVEMLLLRAAGTPSSPGELDALVWAIESIGEPRRAAKVLSQYLARHPTETRAWRLSASLLERLGDLDGAIGARKELYQHTHAIDDAVELAQLYWKRQRPEAALDLLRELRAAHQPPPSETAFWTTFGELAWLVESDEEALTAYRILVARPDASPEMAERILELYASHGDVDERITAGLTFYRRWHKPELLLDAMDAAESHERWPRMHELLRASRGHEEQFNTHLPFWLFRAELARHDQRLDEARFAYEHALALAPQAIAPRFGLIDVAMAKKDPQRLGRLIERWRRDAATDPAYFRVYAQAHQQLGHLDEALTFYGRAVKLAPNDDALLFAFAEALDESGRTTAAYRLRRFLRAKLAPLAETALAAPLDHAPLLRRYAILEHAFAGDVASRRWIMPLVRSRRGDEESLAARQLAISWAAESEDWDYARLLVATRAPSARLASERLALALADNDLATVAELLQDPKSELTDSERVTALRHLDRDEAAYALARAGLARAPLQGEQESLRQEIADLEPTQSTHLRASWGVESLGPLTVDQPEVRADLKPVHGFQFELRSAFADLHAAESELHLGHGVEFDLTVGALYRRTRFRLAAWGGTNLRFESQLAYGKISGVIDLKHGAEARAEVGVNELTMETAALRAAATRSQALVGLTDDISQREYVAVSAAVRQYRGRDFSYIGQGLEVEGELGHRVSLGNPICRLRLTGSFVANQLADAVPSSVRAIVPTATSVSAILTPMYGSAGAGITFGSGEDGAGRGAPWLRFLGDAWLGWVGPPSRFAYRVEAGLGARVSGSGLLTLKGFYGNDQGGAAGQPYMGAQAAYVHRFAN